MRKVLVAILVAFTGACSPKHALPTLEKSSELSFANIKKQILTPYCISCHTGHHKNYENYGLVSASAQSLLESMTTNDLDKRMPKKSSPLPEDLILLFRNWVDAGAPLEAGQSNEPTESLLGFAEIKENVLDKYACTDCHSHYQDYRVVIKELGSILEFIADDRMPFPKEKFGNSTPMSPEDKSLLMTWVNNRAPEFAGVTDRPKSLSPLAPNWISLRNRVFGPKCIKCHNSYGPRGKGDFTSHLKIRQLWQKKPLLFNVESPIDSHFIGAILGRIDDDELFFTTMPLNRNNDDLLIEVPPLTDEEMATIEEWIGLGLPYDLQDQ